MKKNGKNISGLLEYSSNRKKETEAKVFAAIDKLKRSKTKSINFKTVSELSGVSTTTLYNNSILRERINSLKAISKEITNQENDEYSKVQSLREEIRKLKEDKKLLIKQLIELEAIKEENNYLKLLLNKTRNKRN